MCSNNHVALKMQRHYFPLLCDSPYEHGFSLSFLFIVVRHHVTNVLEFSLSTMTRISSNIAEVYNLNIMVLCTYKFFLFSTGIFEILQGILIIESCCYCEMMQNFSWKDISVAVLCATRAYKFVCHTCIYSKCANFDLKKSMQIDLELFTCFSFCVYNL